MAYNLEFIVDQVKVHPEIHQFVNGIALIRARWKITNTDYPDGFAYHLLQKSFSHDSYTLETFVPAEDVTDAMMEEWLTGDMHANTKQNIKMASLQQIMFSHEEAQLTTYYENTGD